MTSDPGPRIVLLTGASSGIGRESALRFARRGDVVVAVASHRPALDELAAEQPGIEVEVCDLTVTGQRAALVQRVLDRHGRVDVLVNNAGVGAVGLLHELSAEDLERVYLTNVVGTADLTRLVLPSMLARGSGAVVLLSSIAAWYSGPPVTVYCSSKFAVAGLVEGLRRETAGTGVRVHSVNPAPIATHYLTRTADVSPQPGEPEVPPGPGFPVAWAARAVVAAADARRPVTRSVPRVAGVVRLAQLPPVGAVLDLVAGRLSGPVVTGVRKLVDDRVRVAAGR